MLALFYINAAIAIVATLFVVFAKHPVHALLYFIASLLALSMSMYALGAPLAAALEVIVYAGAIMVLFIFVVMLLNLGPGASGDESTTVSFARFTPGAIAIVLLCEIAYVLSREDMTPAPHYVVDVKMVATKLWSDYGFLVEVSSFILLIGMVGALVLGKKPSENGKSS